MVYNVFLEMNQNYGDRVNNSFFYRQKIENTEYRHDIDYHNINTIAGISIILVHLHDKLMQKLH